MPRKPTARLVASLNRRITQAVAKSTTAEHAVRATERRHQQELQAAREADSQSTLAVYEVRQAAFEELLHCHGKEQCSLCLQEISRPKVKLICKINPQSFAYNAPQSKLPDWSSGAQILRICPECEHDRAKGGLSFLDLARGHNTRNHHEMSSLWFPARLNGESWEVYHENGWQPLPNSAIQGYFQNALRATLVLTVAQRLGWDIQTRANMWDEHEKTIREQYADALAEKRRKQRAEKRRPRGPRRRELYGAKAA